MARRGLEVDTPWAELSKEQFVGMKNDWLDHWCPVLPKPSQQKVLRHICRWQNYETGDSFWGYESIAKKIGCSPKTVQRAVDELETMGLIRVDRLATAPRNAHGMLLTPRRGGRANNYSIDYNLIRLPATAAGGWQIQSSSVAGPLARAVAELRLSQAAGGTQETSASPGCPTNVVNDLNVSNERTSMDAGARKSRKAPRLRPVLTVTQETTAQELAAAYPDTRSDSLTTDWSLHAASLFARWALRSLPETVPVDISLLAVVMHHGAERYGRRVVVAAMEEWFADRQVDDSMRNPGAMFYREADAYFEREAVAASAAVQATA
ncbi:helix-turn-helix domain-containing protein [Pedococcus sp. 2YAF34]|uniref:helix-turn-helix domain-containing protein n=1 Tax=Pedococcus sp. 2YAF34 TaxID=3233032 RepID=UPI003F9DD971